MYQILYILNTLLAICCTIANAEGTHVHSSTTSFPKEIENNHKRRRLEHSTCHTEQFGPAYLFDDVDDGATPFSTKSMWFPDSFGTYNAPPRAMGESPVCYMGLNRESCQGSKYRFSFQGRNTKARLGCIMEDIRTDASSSASTDPNVLFDLAYVDLNGDTFKDLVVTGCIQDTQSVIDGL